jgi:hypothetical protein
MDSEISSRITRRNSAFVHASPPGSILEGFNCKEKEKIITVMGTKKGE